MKTDSKPTVDTAQRHSAGDADVIAAIEHALSALEYGLLALTVHGGKVVQIDVTHRTRF